MAINDVEGFDSLFTKPTLKTDLTVPLIVSKFKENIFYLIVDAPQSNDGPEIGESLCIHYDFKPYRSGMFGYEHLSVFIYRLDKTGRNFVKYFKNTKDLEEYLNGFELIINKKIALDKIKSLEQDIEKYKKDYEL